MNPRNNALPSSPPVLLPPGWVETWDATQQRNYYYHAQTRATQWARPLPLPLRPPVTLPPPVALPLPPTVPFDPRRGNNHYQHQGSMRNPQGRDDASHQQHAQQQPQQQHPHQQQQLQSQYPYPGQVPPQQIPQFFQQPVAQQQQQPQQQYFPYYQQPPHQQQLPYPPEQQQYPSQQPPLSQQQQPPPWNNPTPHRIPPQQQPNHSTTNQVYSYNPAGNAMIRTTPGTAAAFTVEGAPSDPPQPPPPSGSTGGSGTGIYNAQQEFEELRAMTTGQIALLCKLQHEQESHEKQNNDPEKNDATETTTEETKDSASSTSNAQQARYTPIALSSMAYVSLAQHRTEPGRLDVRLQALRDELGRTQ